MVNPLGYGSVAALPALNPWEMGNSSRAFRCFSSRSWVADTHMEQNQLEVTIGHRQATILKLSIRRTAWRSATIEQIEADSTDMIRRDDPTIDKGCRSFQRLGWKSQQPGFGHCSFRARNLTRETHLSNSLAALNLSPQVQAVS